MNLKAVGSFAKDVFSRWSQDKASRLAAALAYFALFSVAPLLIIVIVVAGQIFSQASVRADILTQVQNTLGSSGASLVQTMIENASRPGSGIAATVLSVVTMLLGAMGVFGQLHGALNTVWDIEPKSGRGVLGIIKDRGLAFVAVIGIGILFILLFALSTAISAVQKYLGGFLPGSRYIWQAIDFVVSLAILTLLFAMVFKVLPDAVVAWRDLWLGALVTAILMSIGNILIGLYLGRSSAASAYGAAGSLVLLLIWIYYSAQVFFFGAEFTQVYAARRGLAIQPAANAVRVFRETSEQREERLRQAGAEVAEPTRPAEALGTADESAPGAPQPAPNSLAIMLLVAATIAAVFAGIVRGPKSE
jgi:membrane protein